MLPIGAVLVDFDGTACTADVSEELLKAFSNSGSNSGSDPGGGPGWRAYDEAVDRGEIGLRTSILAQNAMLTAGRDELLAFALENCPLDPTFAPFFRWLVTRDVPLAIVSDGFGFYIRPILEAAGLGGLTVITNEQLFDEEGRPAGLSFISGNAECIGCGTCKMQAVQRHRAVYGPVAFVGEGQTDRYGALYADIVFAKDALPAYCEQDGVPFILWEDFDDIRAELEGLRSTPDPVAPAICPGWTPVAGSAGTP